MQTLDRHGILESAFTNMRSKKTALVGPTVIDGRGGEPLRDAVVLIRGDRIEAVGPRTSTSLPPDAVTVNARGLTLLPGLIDAHLHLDGDDSLPARYLDHGVTSVRDPGA